jgi:hypothetical protein
LKCSSKANWDTFANEGETTEHSIFRIKHVHGATLSAAQACLLAEELCHHSPW